MIECFGSEHSCSKASMPSRFQPRESHANGDAASEKPISPRIQAGLLSGKPYVVLVTGCVLLCLLLFLWGGASGAPSTSAGGGARNVSSVRSAPLYQVSAPDKIFRTPPMTRPFRISDVTIDKPEVCRGERALVSLKATHQQGQAELLVPSINGRVGWAVSVVAPGVTPGTYDIPIQLGDPRSSAPGEPVDHEQVSAHIRVRDCDVPASLWLSSRQPTSIEEDVRLRVTWLGATPDTESRAQIYVWDFGDGHEVSTTTTEVRHVYPDEEERGTDKRVFTYVIQAEAFDRQGHSLARGKLALTLRNHVEELKYTDHRLQLVARYHPYPEVAPDGAPFINVSLTNLDPQETADLTSLEFRAVPCGSGESRVERHEVVEVFDQSQIPPRGTINGRLFASPAISPDTCHLDVSVSGGSLPSKLDVGGNFSMRVRMDDAAVEEVLDSKRKAEIETALALLQKPYATLEDLADLVQRGRLSPSALGHSGADGSAPGAHAQ